MEDGQNVKPLTIAERRFRWVFMRALKRQRAKGNIDKKQYRRYKVAVWSGLPIATGDGGETGPFVRHLYREVAKRKAKTGLFDNFEWSIDGMLEWLMENWQIVVRIILSLLIFLDKAELE